MMRRLTFTTLLLVALPVVSSGQTWVTVKGQVVLPASVAIPAPAAVNVTQDKAHCNSKGPLMRDNLLINAKNRGVKNVWVYLRPDSDKRDAKLDPVKEINPKLLKSEPVTHTIDQPCCQFVPRILAIREGDFVEVKNTSPVQHNINLTANTDGSPAFNKTIAPAGKYTEPKAFVAFKNPVIFACNIHPWMGGQMMVFDHPYFAVTDADGKFEIKDAPAGKFRLVYRHEDGYHKGKEGVLGFPVTIAAGADGKTMEVKTLDLVLPKQE